MKTVGVRLYGKRDIRLEEFELPPLGKDELLMRVVSDSLCFSTYKAVMQGEDHKRVPKDVAENPIVIGHETCGEIVAVGEDLRDEWQPGQKVVIQPALNLPDSPFSVGYSFPYIGGNMTYAVVPRIVIERNCILPYNGDSYFKGSLVEPISCVLRAFKGMYHIDQETFVRTDGTKEGGRMAILGGAGPMGIAAIDIALHREKPSVLVVTDVNQERLDLARSRFPEEEAARNGITLEYVNVAEVENEVAYLMEIAGGGFDDVFVFTPSQHVLKTAQQIMGRDGCLNFFAGPTDKEFSAPVNFYRVHYDSIHILGTAGGVPEDTVDTIKLIEDKVLNPGAIVTHIGGLDSVIDSVLNMDKPVGLKILIYNETRLPLTAIADFAELGKESPLFRELDRIVQANAGLWCAEAERYLLENAERI